MAKDMKAEMAAAGVPWDVLLQFIMNMNWIQFAQFIRQLIDAFRQRPVVMEASPVAAQECAKEHFAAIKALAECGEKHCAA